jgi:hypothetical protein
VSDFDAKSWVPLAITSLIVIGGWFIAHRLSAKRDAANKRREIQVNALRSIYMKLANASRRPMDVQVAQDIESLVSEIQLYGDKRLTDLTGTLVNDYKAGGWVSFDALLKELRDQIREDLSLSKIEGEVWWLRFKTESDKQKANESSATTSGKTDG